MKVIVTGSSGMLGRQVFKTLESMPGVTAVPVDRVTVDLADAVATSRYFASVAADAVIHTAAHVGDIGERVERPGSFLTTNLRIDDSVISAALDNGVRRLLYISSAGVYPQDCPQPITPDALLTGPIEGPMEPYALAKIVGMKRCEYAKREHGVQYTSIVPTNMYGEGEETNLKTAHLVPAALGKVHAAKESGAPSVEVWGDGTARRELMFAPDAGAWLAQIAASDVQLPDALHLGSGDEMTVREIYERVCEVVAYEGELAFDTSKPSGVAQRVLDSSAANALGFTNHTSFDEGLGQSYQHYLAIASA